MMELKMKIREEDLFGELSKGRSSPFGSPFYKEHFLIAGIFVLSIIFGVIAVFKL